MLRTQPGGNYHPIKTKTKSVVNSVTAYDSANLCESLNVCLIHFLTIYLNISRGYFQADGRDIVRGFVWDPGSEDGSWLKWLDLDREGLDNTMAMVAIMGEFRLKAFRAKLWMCVVEVEHHVVESTEWEDLAMPMDKTVVCDPLEELHCSQLDTSWDREVAIHLGKGI